MNHKLHVSLAVLLCALLALSVYRAPRAAEESPAFPALPIDGLSLPEGSVFKGQPDRRAELQHIMGKEQVIDELTVIDFDYPGGWDALLKHVAPQLIEAGFTDDYKDREGYQEVMDDKGPLLVDMTALMRSYTNPKTGAQVFINNITARFDRENVVHEKLEDGRTIRKWAVVENVLEEGESQYQLQIMTFE